MKVGSPQLAIPDVNFLYLLYCKKDSNFDVNHVIFTTF